MRLTIYVLQLSGISTVTCAVVTTICTALSSSQTETLHPLSSSSLSPPSSPSQSPSCFCLCEVSSKWMRPRFVLCVWIISLGTVSLRFIRIAARIWNSFLSLCVCVCVCVWVAQLCPTLCNPMDYSPPGSSVHGIPQARYWSLLLFPLPGDLPDPGTEPQSPGLWADSTVWATRGAPFPLPILKDSSLQWRVNTFWIWWVQWIGAMRTVGSVSLGLEFCNTLLFLIDM